MNLECSYCGEDLTKCDELGFYRDKYLTYKNKYFCDEECLDNYVSEKAEKESTWVNLSEINKDEEKFYIRTPLNANEYQYLTIDHDRNSWFWSIYPKETLPEQELLEGELFRFQLKFTQDQIDKMLMDKCGEFIKLNELKVSTTNLN